MDKKNVPDLQGQFRAKYGQLKDRADDDPKGLFDFAKLDDGVMSLCVELGLIAMAISAAERRIPQLFTGPVDPDFVKEWRDYEARYADQIKRIHFYAEPAFVL